MLRFTAVGDSRSGVVIKGFLSSGLAGSVAQRWIYFGDSRSEVVIRGFWSRGLDGGVVVASCSC